MVRYTLTVKEVENAKPKANTARIFDGGGLYLEITPQNGKYWRYKYRYQGSEKRMALGVYPEVSLKEAREKHSEFHKMVSSGIDPMAQKKEFKQAAIADANLTLEVAINQWLEKKEKELSPSYYKDTKARLEKDVLYALGRKPLNSVTTPDIVAVLKVVEARGAHELARRLKAAIRSVYSAAIANGLAKTNPAADFDAKDVLVSYKKGHHPCIKIDELPEFLQALKGNKARIYPLTQMATELLMLTFVRTNELIGGRWEEIDWKNKQWVIPAERMKMRLEHIVPLSNQALAILERLKAITGNREFIFPNQIDPRKTMSNNTILQALAAMGYKGKMSGHGFRALGMSAAMEKLGYRREVPDLQLAHRPKGKNGAAYERAEFIDERSEMMQDWADFIDKQTKLTSSKE